MYLQIRIALIKILNTREGQNGSFRSTRVVGAARSTPRNSRCKAYYLSGVIVMLGLVPYLHSTAIFDTLTANAVKKGNGF